MRIAINTRFLLPHKMEGFGWYTYEIVKRLVENHPEHEFIFFFDRKFDPKFVFAENVTPVVLNPPARHPILFKIWYNISVKRALKKYKADVFFSPDGYLSLTTDVKQVNVMHDLNFEHLPDDLKPVVLNYYKTYFPKFAQKSEHIITVSNYSKQDIITTYGIDETKITAIWNGASDAFKPVSVEQKQATREQYTDGRPYFLFVGAIHPRKNVKRLIEAYSQFKQRHPEREEQLLIVGAELWNNSGGDLNIDETVKNQIHFTGHLDLDELAKIMASATIFTFVPYFEGFGIPLVEAMKSGTPILSGNLTSLPEVAADAALYCDPMDVNDIAAKLEQLTLDTTLQEELSQKGLERAKVFSWDTAAANVWKVIEASLS